MTASATASRPALSCRGPTPSVMSFLYIIIIIFPVILLKTSPTPIGPNPGFLPKGINLQASSDVVPSSSSMQSIFTVGQMLYANYLMMFHIPLELKFRAIHLHQNQTFLILHSLTLQFSKSRSRQYHRKLRDEFSLLFLLSVLQVEVL